MSQNGPQNSGLSSLMHEPSVSFYVDVILNVRCFDKKLFFILSEWKSQVFSSSFHIPLPTNILLLLLLLFVFMAFRFSFSHSYISRKSFRILFLPFSSSLVYSVRHSVSLTVSKPVSHHCSSVSFHVLWYEKNKINNCFLLSFFLISLILICSG